MQHADAVSPGSPLPTRSSSLPSRSPEDDGVGFALGLIGAVVLLLVLTAVAADWMERWA
jgi:tetrahydromethanopterin S-methyltransferase subunit F